MYYHSSTIYSIFALSNADESVVERYRHTAYGETTVLDADGSDDADGLSDVGNPYLFQSRRWEGAAGIMQFRHREYAPDLGRFLSRDPVRKGFNVGLYVYAGDSPVNRVDPLGEVDWKPWIEYPWKLLTAYPDDVKPFNSALVARALGERPTIAKAWGARCLCRKIIHRVGHGDKVTHRQWHYTYREVHVDLKVLAHEKKWEGFGGPEVWATSFQLIKHGEWVARVVSGADWLAIPGPMKDVMAAHRFVTAQHWRSDTGEKYWVNDWLVTSPWWWTQKVSGFDSEKGVYPWGKGWGAKLRKHNPHMFTRISPTNTQKALPWSVRRGCTEKCRGLNARGK